MSAAVFWVPAKGIARCCLCGPCSPHFHQGYGEFGALNVFFLKKNSGEIFTYAEGSFGSEHT
jgi:hypothetical protein